MPDVGAAGDGDIGAFHVTQRAGDINLMGADSPRIAKKSCELFCQELFDRRVASIFCKDKVAAAKGMMVVESILKGIQAGTTVAGP